MVFSDLLRVLKDFLVFGKGEGCDNVLVLPVNKSKERLIDFEILRKNKSLRDQKKRPSVVEDIDGYLGKIVSPWYRAEEKVREHFALLIYLYKYCRLLEIRITHTHTILQVIFPIFCNVNTNELKSHHFFMGLRH